MVGHVMISARVETWPIAGTFTISRGSKTEAVVVVAEVTDGQITGRGECVPYARYGETPESVLAEIRAAHAENRDELLAKMSAGAARNAIDCAFWDFEAKARDRRAYALAGIDHLRPVLTAYTLSLASPEEMAAKAAAASDFPLLKLKLGGGDGADAERLRAVRAARPKVRLIADANEAWRSADIGALLAVCAETHVELVEQPLPADDDAILGGISRPVPVCADESVHTRAELAGLVGRYDAVNIKLDKTGGLTEALAMESQARALGLKIMVGCMVSTSLSMAPALIAAQNADWADLDGPLLLARDRSPAVQYANAVALPPPPALWG